VEETEFRPAEYLKYLESIREETEAFQAKRSAAFQAERDHWEAIGEFDAQEEAEDAAVEVTSEEAAPLQEGEEAVSADMTANVWKTLVEPGAEVEEGDVLFILEAMKMEMSILAPCSGKVSEVLCESGKMVAPGQRLAVIQEQPQATLS